MYVKSLGFKFVSARIVILGSEVVDEGRVASYWTVRLGHDVMKNVGVGSGV